MCFSDGIMQKILYFVQVIDVTGVTAVTVITAADVDSAVTGG